MEQIPIYVTRKSAQGSTGTLSANPLIPLFLLLLAAINAFVWGLIGLVEAVRYFA